MDKPITASDIIDALSGAFPPDIRLKVVGEKSIIIGYEALTTPGAHFILLNSLLDRSYDEIDFGEITREIIFAD